METTIFEGIGTIIMQICLAAFIVFCAMTIDLASGLYKAKLRGEVHSSWGLKRSIQKFILYEGAVLIAGGIDILFHTCRVMRFIGCEVLVGIALFTGLIAILLCIVELLSLREKADDKTRKDISRAGEVFENIIDRRLLVESIAKALSESLNPHDTTHETDT